MADSHPIDAVVLDGDVPLAVRLHRAAADPFERRPAVIVMGSWLTVKEQMADLYAARLAQRGYMAVTFDFAGFGRSGGSLRQAELPGRKIANLAAVERFVATSSLAAPGGVGALAICASAQYTLAAIAAGVPLASFASVAGWYHDTASVAPFYGGADGVRERFERADAASRHLAESGELTTVPAYAAGDERAGMFIELDYYAEAERGAVPEWRNEMAEISWRHWLGFDGLSAAAGVSVPSLFVHSDAAVLPDNVRAVAERVGGPVQSVWTEGEQIDFYDQPDQVSTAIEAADEHFSTTLGAPA